MSIIESLKEHDLTLNQKDVPFERRIISIIGIWKTIVSIDLSHCKLKYLVEVVDWAILHTLNLLLNAEWNRWHEIHELDLLNGVEHARIMLVQRNYGFNSRCEKVAYVLKSPWSNPVLMRVMQIENVEMTQDVIDFFCYEETHLISVRINKLCESSCEDIALNLVKAYFRAYEVVENGKCMLNATSDQISFIFDIRLVLLYKFKRHQELQKIIEDLDFQECLIVVERFAHKRVDFLKLWKYSPKIAMYAIQTRLHKIVFTFDESRNTEDLKILVNTYIDFCFHEKLQHNVCQYLKDMSLYVDSSVIYEICEIIHNRQGSKLKSLTIELFIRGLTCDINELEKEKLQNDSHGVIESTRRLAARFGKLTTFLEESPGVSSECLLTAFSLDPTKEYLDRIEDMARKFGFQVSEDEQRWKCKLHPPALASDEVTWKCPECLEWMCKPVSDIPLGTNMALNEAIRHTDLNLPESLCDDLIICLSNPRYHILSWSLPWDVLHRLCIMYFKDPNAMKNFITDLKFLDIDYSMFDKIKQEPPDEYPGIEKGFEKYLNDDYFSTEQNILPNEDIEENDKKRVLTDDSPQCLTQCSGILKRKSEREELKEQTSEVSKNDRASDENSCERELEAVEPKTLLVGIKRKKNKKCIGEEYDPNSMKTLRKYFSAKKSRVNISSVRRYCANKAEEVKNAGKDNSVSDIPIKVVRREGMNVKKYTKKEKKCNDANYDPNSLATLKKYIKSKQLKEEISSTRKYYKKSLQNAQYYNMKSDEIKNQLGSVQCKAARNNLSQEEKTNVVDNVEKCLQNYIEGEEYDPNSIESLKKCVNLEKSKEKLLSRFRKKGMAPQQSVLRSNILRSAVSYGKMKGDKAEAFEYDCWSNFDEATKTRYEYLKNSRYLTLHRK